MFWSKLITHAAIGAVCAVSAWQAQGWRLGEQIQAERLAHASTMAAAERAASDSQRQIIQTIAEARNAAAKREKSLRDAGDVLRDELDGLREQARESNRFLSTAGVDAARATAAAATALLNECAAKYQAMARNAEGHANDSLMLQESWPK